MLARNTLPEKIEKGREEESVGEGVKMTDGGLLAMQEDEVTLMLEAASERRREERHTAEG